MVQIQIFWANISKPNEFLDVDTHIDIEKETTTEVVHSFNNNKEQLFETEKLFLKESKRRNPKKKQICLSKVIISKGFNPKHKYTVYLYSFASDFGRIKAKAEIFHYRRGYIGCF